MSLSFPRLRDVMPSNYNLFYDGSWHLPLAQTRRAPINPSTGEVVIQVGQANTADVDAAVKAAQTAFLS